jgi:medium-chain acyl-[acyl-carrier-protein] hydrolase
MSPSPPSNLWLPYRPRAAAPRLRLVALPYAGGGATVFRQWPDALPPDVELCAVQLPGRETRFNERGYVRMADLIPDLATALEPEFDRPFVLFGHSMGALVALELARELRRRSGPQPAMLIVAGHAAPHRPAREPTLHVLPDAEFRAQLRRLNGTPGAVLDNDELLQAFVPTLRADFALCETYVCAEEPPLDVSIVACGGILDPRASYDDIDAWRVHTRAPFTLRMFAGDHFFLQSHRDELVGFIAEQLAMLDPPTPRMWPITDRVPPLAENEVHVWRIDLDENVEKICRLEGLLSPDERERAGRFHFRQDRERFIVGRGALRSLLGNYLKHEPAEIALWYNSHGKPSLKRTADDIDLRFNLAHSGGQALIALAVGRSVGVDLERIRTDVECAELAERFFSPRESAALSALRVTERVGAFFACWTRKEAYVKAHGIGLTLPLDRFSVSLDEPARLLSTEHDPSALDRWELHDLDLGSGYAGALAVEGTGARVRGAKWTGVAVE